MKNGSSKYVIVLCPNADKTHGCFGYSYLVIDREIYRDPPLPFVHAVITTHKYEIAYALCTACRGVIT